MEGGSNVDGDEFGGTSPSRQGADTGIMSPRNLMAMAAEIGITSREKGSGIRVSSAGVKIGGKGGTERGHQAANRVLPSFLGDSGGFRDADFFYNFSRIFGPLL